MGNKHSKGKQSNDQPSTPPLLQNFNRFPIGKQLSKLLSAKHENKTFPAEEELVENTSKTQGSARSSTIIEVRSQEIPSASPDNEKSPARNETEGNIAQTHVGSFNGQIGDKTLSNLENKHTKKTKEKKKKTKRKQKTKDKCNEHLEPVDNNDGPFGDNINGLFEGKTLPPLKNKDENVTKEKKKKRKNNSFGHLESNIPDDIENFHHQIDKLKFELQQKEKQIDQLTNRLSALASAKLRDNNPDIADLSDQNRPTKLAEKFSELYDNEWTAAYADIEETHKNMNEKKIVNLLLKSIKEVYQQCVEVSEKDMNDLKTQIALFTSKKEFPEKLAYSMKIYKDERKKCYKAKIPELKQRFGNVCDKMYMDIPTVESYITASVELCWLMCVQDPPVVMYTKCKKGDSFDEKLFKGYTKSSSTVAFLVWPALFLHENGQLLSKGVAQGKSRKKRSLTKGRINKVSVPVSDQNEVNTNLLSLSLNLPKLSDKGTYTSDREDETASSVDQFGSNPEQIVSETHDTQSERMSDCRIAELAMKSQLQKTKSYKGGDATTTMHEDLPGVATGQ